MDATSAIDEQPKHSGEKAAARRWLTGPADGGGDTTAKRRLAGGDDGDTTVNRWLSGDGGGDGDCDGGEAWEALSKSLKEAQTALDKNRLLIQQVNENHQSKIPDNLVKNVELIKEINCNISKVSDVYSDLSINFTDFVNRKRKKKTKNDKVEDE